MHYVLSIIILCCFLLMCFALLLIIFQGISIILLQITERIYIAPFVSCKSIVNHSTLYFKKCFIDVIFVYAKHKGKFYFLGQNGVYKASLMGVKKVDIADLNSNEKSLIEKMKNDAYCRTIEDKKILDAYISQYEQSNHNDIVGNS